MYFLPRQPLPLSSPTKSTSREIPRGDGFHLRLLPRVDSVLLVAAYDRTGKHPLARMAEVIQRQGGRIAGCVLNRRREPIPEFIYRRLFW